MRRVASNVLGGLATVGEVDREVLLETLSVWIDCSGSVNDASARMFVHPNTIRHRLRRLEERTGKSLADPRSLAELCVALETMQRLSLDS